MEMVPVELTTPAEKKKYAIISFPLMFSGPVTEVPRRLVTDSCLEAAVTDSASVTAEPPTVALLLTVRLPAERAPEIVADAQERVPEIVGDAQESAEAVADIAPAVTVSPAARVAAECPEDIQHIARCCPDAIRHGAHDELKSATVRIARTER